MSGRVGKQRGTAANIETATTTVNERILKVRLPARWWLQTAGPATSLRARGDVDVAGPAGGYGLFLCFDSQKLHY